MKSTVTWAPRKPIKVILELDSHEYTCLIACLTAHSSNNIENGRVLDCGTAKGLLDQILNSIGT